MTPRPLTLPRIAATEAQALSRLARLVLELPLDAAWQASGSVHAAPRLSLRYMGAAMSPLNPEDAVRSRIEWSGCRLALDVPKSAAEEWTQAVLGGEVAPSLPGPWRLYALEQALQWVVGSLSACGKGHARLTESGLMATGPVDGARHRFLLSLDFEETALSVQAVLHTDNLGLLMLAGLVPAATLPAQGAVQAADMSVRVHLTLGWSDMGLSDAVALQTGDVVFITRPLFDGPQHMALRAEVPSGPTRRAMVRQEGLTLTVISEALAMNDAAEQPEGDVPDDLDLALRGDEPDEPAQPLQAMRVRLSFDVGHQDMSLAELERLQPGEVITLQQPVGEIVTLRANGTAVGRGSLVEVDGRVGVLLTEWGGWKARP